MDEEVGERRQWFQKTVLPLESWLRRTIRRIDSTVNVDDLLHDTYIRLLTTAGWRDIEAIPAYLERTARNLHIDQVRRQKIVPIEVLSEAHESEMASYSSSAEDVASAREELRQFESVLAGLPAQCRRVVTLRKVYGLNNLEVAEKLGLSVSTVEKHFAKGLLLCSKHLARMCDASSRGLDDTAATMLRIRGRN
ncbi:MAG: RNA polymerase sigma factor [Proteobacteria bacterium]|nr:RNA polymerase sigma factor [Pseudomonadota bacterium]